MGRSESQAQRVTPSRSLFIHSMLLFNVSMSHCSARWLQALTYPNSTKWRQKRPKTQPPFMDHRIHDFAAHSRPRSGAARHALTPKKPNKAWDAYSVVYSTTTWARRSLLAPHFFVHPPCLAVALFEVPFHCPPPPPPPPPGLCLKGVGVPPPPPPKCPSFNSTRRHVRSPNTTPTRVPNRQLLPPPTDFTVPNRFVTALSLPPERPPLQAKP